MTLKSLSTIVAAGQRSEFMKEDHTGFVWLYLRM
jgi:hypothetical protein